jgi:hypothetical protein
MESLFSPCTRLHDILESQHRLEIFRFHHPELLQELNLNVSTEDLLSAERAFTYADLYAMLGNEYTLAWLTPYAAVVRNYERAMRYWKELDDSYHLSFSTDAKVIIALARSPEHLSELCDVVVRLLALGVVESVCLNNSNYLDGAFINAPTLAYLMEQCQSLKVLTLKELKMDEDIIRVLGAYSRPDLEIVLVRCTTTTAGASALAGVLRRNQGPTTLDQCDIDNFVLADGLRGNSRLKSLKLRFSGNLEVRNRQILAIADAVRENKGLVEFGLRYYFCLKDETWGAICDSLETHPTLEVLDLRGAFMDDAPAPAVLKSRIQAILDMVKMNLSLHTIHLPDRYSEHEIFRGSVVPYLETNRFRPRLLVIQKTRPFPYRAKVLGRALLADRTNPNRFWMLLLGNAEVAFPSRTTAAAANLPAPATAAATSTSTTDVAAFAVHVTTAATAGLPTAAAAVATGGTPSSTASDVFPFASTIAAAAKVVTPSSGQKRSARP